MNGLNMEPCQSYSLADRFMCEKCGCPPRLTKATGNETIMVEYTCHGESGQGVFSKSDLMFTQIVFKKDE